MKKLMKLWVIVLGVGLLFSSCDSTDKNKSHEGTNVSLEGNNNETEEEKMLNEEAIESSDSSEVDYILKYLERNASSPEEEKFLDDLKNDVSIYRESNVKATSKMFDDIEGYVSALEKGEMKNADKYDKGFSEKYNIGLGFLHLMYDLEGEDFLTEFTSGDAALKSRAGRVFRRWAKVYEEENSD